MERGCVYLRPGCTVLRPVCVETMMIDYAHPLMMAEKHAKQAHDALLMRDWKQSKEEILQAITELRLAYNAVVHIEEQNMRDKK